MNDSDMLTAMVCDDTTTASKQTRDRIKLWRMEFETQENCEMEAVSASAAAVSDQK